MTFFPKKEVQQVHIENFKDKIPGSTLPKSVALTL